MLRSQAPIASFRKRLEGGAGAVLADLGDGCPDPDPDDSGGLGSGAFCASGFSGIPTNWITQENKKWHELAKL